MSKPSVNVVVKIVQRETEKALLVALENGQEMWMPKSQIMSGSEVSSEGDSGMMKISEWIAGEKGLMSNDDPEVPQTPQKELETFDDIPF